MFTVHLMDRETSEIVVSDYASGFPTYEEAREWADDQEISFRACGWTAVVAPMPE